jgi:hypothetical protein
MISVESLHRIFYFKKVVQYAGKIRIGGGNFSTVKCLCGVGGSLKQQMQCFVSNVKSTTVKFFKWKSEIWEDINQACVCSKNNTNLCQHYFFCETCYLVIAASVV